MASSIDEQSDSRVPNILKQLQIDTRIKPQNSIEKHHVHQILGILNRLPLYRNTLFQQEVYRVVPWETLSLNASRRVLKAKQLLQDDQNADDAELNPKDVFLFELLKWFKQEFFNWFQHPKCSCNNTSMRYGGTVSPNGEESKWLANYVELYLCDACRRAQRFARYNHPLQLLRTRVGRCGEWANCFAGICVALNYDIRIVLESGDHVWVEVRSEQQQRWLHCDPCEQALDTPYMYEQGWNKSITYCFAVGFNEIQDVTWAYTMKIDAVLARRRDQCREQWLISMITFINKCLQSSLQSSTKNEILKRSVQELASYLRLPGQLCGRALKSGEVQGRSSGSLQWRLTRGELGNTSEPVCNRFKFQLDRSHIQCDNGNEQIKIFYDVSKDSYQFGKTRLSGWKTGVWSYDRIFRKVEQDWQMAYLSRTDGSTTHQEGVIEWSIDWSQLNRSWKQIVINLMSTCFHDAEIQFTLIVQDDITLPLITNQTNHVERDQVPLDCNSVILRARLIGGEGQMAWQHAQLFRQSLQTTNSFGLQISIKL